MAGLGADWGPTGRTPTPFACSPPSQALMSDYGNEKDHPEDNTSFNPETELNNTDATCAFKCLFERFSLWDSLVKSFFFFLC